MLPIKQTLLKINNNNKYFPPIFLLFFLFQTFYNFCLNLVNTFFCKFDSFFRADEYVQLYWNFTQDSYNLLHSSHIYWLLLYIRLYCF